MSRRKGFRCILLFSATLLLARAVQADVTGSILGTIRDRSGAVIVGAR